MKLDFSPVAEARPHLNPLPRGEDFYVARERFANEGLTNPAVDFDTGADVLSNYAGLKMVCCSPSSRPSPPGRRGNAPSDCEMSGDWRDVAAKCKPSNFLSKESLINLRVPRCADIVSVNSTYW